MQCGNRKYPQKFLNRKHLLHWNQLRKWANPLFVCVHETSSVQFVQRGRRPQAPLLDLFVCVRQKPSIILPCRVLTLQGCAVTCCLINSVLSVVVTVPTAPTAMIKRDALKGWKALPIHSRYFLDAVHTHSTISSWPKRMLCLTLWLGPSQVCTHVSVTFYFPSSVYHFFPLDSLPKLAVLPPLSLLSPSLSARLHIKADDWFLTVQQAVFYLALCEETKIISMNMEKPASMVISSPVISISVKLTWLNLTYI